MIVPAVRLLWLAALVCLPAAALAGFLPWLAGPGGWVLVGCAAAALGDAVAGARRIDSLDARTPTSVRLTKDVPGKIPIAIENRLRSPVAIRVAPHMPEGIEQEEKVRITIVPRVIRPSIGHAPAWHAAITC